MEPVELGVYSQDAGLRLAWVHGFVIEVASNHGEVLIKANPEGLRSLAQHLLTLAGGEVPSGVHVHLEPGQELEDESCSLILERG